MSLVTIGMSHKTASLDVREKLAVDKNESQKILKKLHSMPLVDEAFILSTCNRTEIYYEYENHVGEENKIFHLIMKCLVKLLASCLATKKQKLKNKLTKSIKKR